MMVSTTKKLFTRQKLFFYSSSIHESVIAVAAIVSYSIELMFKKIRNIQGKRCLLEFLFCVDGSFYQITLLEPYLSEVDLFKNTNKCLLL